jgi:hypothetical protein
MKLATVTLTAVVLTLLSGTAEARIHRDRFRVFTDSRQADPNTLMTKGLVRTRHISLRRPLKLKAGQKAVLMLPQVFEGRKVAALHVLRGGEGFKIWKQRTIAKGKFKGHTQLVIEADPGGAVPPSRSEALARIQRQDGYILHVGEQHDPARYADLLFNMRVKLLP